MLNERKMLLEGEWNPESRDWWTEDTPEAPADWSAEVLDATMKSELGNLALQVDIMNDNKEAQFSAIDALFWKDGKLNSLDEKQKNEALKYALKDVKIKMWTGEISVMEIATLFWKYVNQDENKWSLKVAEIPEWDDKKYEEALKILISSPKESPLAYLIQKTSNLATIQAGNWYGAESEANKLREIKEDKILGNQTRRALAWLRSWVEWWKVEAENIPNMTVEDVLKLKYISQETMEAFKNGGKDEVKRLWDDLDAEESKYEYRVPYTNNYALKEKETDPDSDQNQEQVLLNTPDFVGNIDMSVKNGILDALKTDTNELLGSEYTPTLSGNDIVIKKNWTNFEEKIPLSKCMNSDKNYNHEFIKIAVENAINKIKVKEKAVKWADIIKTKRYEFNDIFSWDLSEFDNDMDKARVRNFFWIEGTWQFWTWWSSRWISLGWTAADGENIWLVLNINSWSNYAIRDLLIYTKNPALKLEAKDLIDDNNNLNEDVLKEKIKDAIIWIIQNPVYINSLA